MHPTAGSLYWLGLRDSTGATLDGAKSYKLTVPQHVPGKLFWSVTVYDTDTRSQVQTDLGKAALRSMFELKDVSKTQPTDLYLAPPLLRATRTNGSRPSQARAGLSTSASTAPNKPPSTAHGNQATLSRSN
jgi:Protein of unknown function (DUF1214)